MLDLQSVVKKRLLVGPIIILFKLFKQLQIASHREPATSRVVEQAQDAFVDRTPATAI